MPFHLICELDEQHRRFRIGDDKGQHLIGSSADCDLQLPFPTVSRHHARLHISADHIELEDLGSSNGCFVDGERLQDRHPITANSSIRLGSVSLRLQSISADDASLAVALRMSLHAGNETEHDTLPMARRDGLAADSWERLISAVATTQSPLAVAMQIGEALLGDGLINNAEIIDSSNDDDSHACVLLRIGDPTENFSCCVTSGSLKLRANGERADPALLRALLRLLELTCHSPSATTHADTQPVRDEHDIVAADPQMRQIYQRSRRIAGSNLNVLILGESGTGKEVLAQYIRRHAGTERPYVALNCAALAEDLIDAELFGIERGVATGVDARAGKFEQAHGGILFLDEIGDMAASTQARLLRVLQEGEVIRIGGTHPRPARVRVIAATNQNIEAAVAEGRFRLDLLHRIADWQVTLPPLRERPQDIALLAGRFLEAACRERGIRVRGITHAAHAALLAHDWPGNVRELQREMARAAVFLGNDDALSQTDLGTALRHATTPAATDLASQLESAERRILRMTIAALDGNMSEVATRLGIARSTLYRRLEALGLREQGNH